MRTNPRVMKESQKRRRAAFAEGKRSGHSKSEYTQHHCDSRQQVEYTQVSWRFPTDLCASVLAQNSEGHVSQLLDRGQVGSTTADGVDRRIVVLQRHKH
jgi:hypothetical protein